MSPSGAPASIRVAGPRDAAALLELKRRLDRQFVDELTMAAILPVDAAEP